MERAPSPLVTVILPVKDGFPFLPVAVESILGQTFRDFQLLVLDDGSTDGTAAYLRAMADPRLRVVTHQQSQGVGRCLNEGMALATTPLLARQDADDVSEPERLARQVAYLSSHPECLVLGTQGRMIDDAGNFLRPFTKPTTGPEIYESLLSDPPFIHGSVMMRRDRVAQAGGYREKIRRAEDYDLWLRLASPRAFANLPEALYRYRVHDRQVGAAHHREQALETWLCRVLHAERLCTGEGDSLEVLGERHLAAIKQRKIWRPRGSWSRRVRVLRAYAQLLESDSPRLALATKWLAFTGGW